MRFLVTATAYETIVTPDAIQRLRETFLAKVREIRRSGKLIEGGHFVTDRAGFFLLDVARAEELFELLIPLQDFCRVEARMVQSFDELEKRLEANPVK